MTGQLFAGIQQQGRVAAGHVQDRPNLDQVAVIGREEHWILDVRDVCLETPSRLLGVGRFGQVFAGTLNGSPVAVKVARQRGGTSDDDHEPVDLSRIPALINELQILRRIRHPGIVLFQGAVVEPQS